MELFRQTNFDFLGKKWPFIIASLVLTVAGLASLAVKGGPRYGIDFKGGTLMTVKFQNTPPVEAIRKALDKRLTSAPTVQNFVDGLGAHNNEVSIGTEGTDDRQLAKNRQIVVDTLTSTFGKPQSGKLDLNNASSSAIADQLREPLQAAGSQLSDPDLQAVASGIVSYRTQHSGLIGSIDQLSGVPGINPKILDVLKQQAYLAPFAVIQTEVVGPNVGAELRKQAILATLLALGGMLVYIAFRFEWIYGVGAVIAVFHDTIITLGLFSLFDKEISLTVIAALLTLVGYSMNDTIVIFDRIRENLRGGKREKLEDVINRSVNQTLSRTVMTSGLTFLTVIALFLFGGPVLHGFSFALVVGIIVGTYSSVFIASPIVLAWHNLLESRRKPVTGPVSAKSSVKFVK